MGLRAQVALARGEFPAAEELIERCLQMQPVTLIRDNVSTARFQLWQLRREQARAAETEGSIRASIVELPWYPAFRSVWATIALAGLLAATSIVMLERRRHPLRTT
jgi:hypothetical protein